MRQGSTPPRHDKFGEDMDRGDSGADPSWAHLTKDWGSTDSVELYLDRCQVDTPDKLVAEVWEKVLTLRPEIGSVVDYGAGDARFARHGARFESYVGYEIDPSRTNGIELPRNASVRQQCAFTGIEISDACLAIGNPPYVRNQDLPVGWRQQAATAIKLRTGIALSGLANAWQYFFMLSLASTRSDGMVAIVIPYEWVSRPSAKALREYIEKSGWDVWVYRLDDDRFDRVLTTSSITIVDKRGTRGRWHYLEELPDGGFKQLKSASGGAKGVLNYAKRSEIKPKSIRAKRGLSPGTQEALTLTEGERVRLGLKEWVDVVPCVTTLRNLPADCSNITAAVFRQQFRDADRKCWLVRTDREPSKRLRAYFDSVSPEVYQTATCLNRETWWNFTMPDTPRMLIATGFRGERPKVVLNDIDAKAVGSVCGIYGVAKHKRHLLRSKLAELDLSHRLVAHSNGLLKLEINQLNTLLQSIEPSLRRP